MTDTYPADCPCGSRCDGHAIGAPEDPGCEWCGVDQNTVVLTQAEWDELQHQMLHAHHCSVCVCPVCGVVEPPAKVTTIEEIRYSDRSPREEWVGAWKVKQETHR